MTEIRTAAAAELARTAAEVRAAADARLESALGDQLAQRLLVALGATSARS